jgi:hypothetical protein
MTVTLSELNVFPLKSARGIAVPRWSVGPRGLEGDRELMVVDPGGRFVTQREQPRMALIGTAFERREGADELVLTAPNLPTLGLRPSRGALERAPVTVWTDTVLAERVGDEADAWISDFLGMPAHMVRFPDDEVRQFDMTYARAGDQVGFADGFSLLLISEGSLDALNARLATPVGMHRFRPNLVVRGSEPFAEDGWRRILIGAIELDVVKPCTRCLITTVDEALGVHGKEPLATLATFAARAAK